MVDSKTKKVLGKGWNKMPNGCEDRLPWERGRITLKTKYPYGKYSHWLMDNVTQLAGLC